MPLSERAAEVISRAYQEVYETDAGKIVFGDIARWCYASESTFVPGDTHGSALLEGRRQVHLRVRELLDLTEDDIKLLVARATVHEEEE